MLFHKIFESVSSLTEKDPILSQAFEQSFRESLSSLDMQILLSGPIPVEIFRSILSSSLQYTSTHSLQLFESTSDKRYERLHHQLWNPLVSSLVSSISASSLGNRPFHQQSSTSKVRAGSITACFAALSLTTSEEEEIRQKLSDYSQKSNRLYNTKFHAHISCKTDRCRFCYAMFTHVNITKCVGHKPCHRSGYFPHVGTPLWSMIRKKHTSGSCQFKVKPCQSGEIKALAITSLEDTPEYDSSISWADEEESPRSPVQYPELKRKSPESSARSVTKLRKGDVSQADA